MDTLTFNAPILLRHLTFSEARKQPISEINLHKALEGLEMDMSQVTIPGIIACWNSTNYRRHAVYWVVPSPGLRLPWTYQRDWPKICPQANTRVRKPWWDCWTPAREVSFGPSFRSYLPAHIESCVTQVCSEGWSCWRKQEETRRCFGARRVALGRSEEDLRETWCNSRWSGRGKTLFVLRVLRDLVNGSMLDVDRVEEPWHRRSCAVPCYREGFQVRLHFFPFIRVGSSYFWLYAVRKGFVKVQKSSPGIWMPSNKVDWMGSFRPSRRKQPQRLMTRGKTREREKVRAKLTHEGRNERCVRVVFSISLLEWPWS